MFTSDKVVFVPLDELLSRLNPDNIRAGSKRFLFHLQSIRARGLDNPIILSVNADAQDDFDAATAAVSKKDYTHLHRVQKGELRLIFLARWRSQDTAAFTTMFPQGIPCTLCAGTPEEMAKLLHDHGTEARPRGWFEAYKVFKPYRLAMLGCSQADVLWHEECRLGLDLAMEPDNRSKGFVAFATAFEQGQPEAMLKSLYSLYRRGSAQQWDFLLNLPAKVEAHFQAAEEGKSGFNPIPVSALVPLDVALRGRKGKKGDANITGSLELFEAEWAKVLAASEPSAQAATREAKKAEKSTAPSPKEIREDNATSSGFAALLKARHSGAQEAKTPEFLARVQEADAAARTAEILARECPALWAALGEHASEWEKFRSALARNEEAHAPQGFKFPIAEPEKKGKKGK